MIPVQIKAPIVGDPSGGVRWEYRGDAGVVAFALSDNYAVLTIHTLKPNDYNDDHYAEGCATIPGQRVYCASMSEAAKTLHRRWLESGEDDEVIYDGLRAEYAAHVIALGRGR